MSANLFIVPHDFTSVGDAALKHALTLAKPKKSKIILLHILSNKAHKPKATKKLQQIIDNLDLSVGGIQVEAMVEKGNIFDDIPGISKKLDARLIIMGTHGAQGMQKVFGSYAIKVISKSSVPFLIVQDNTTHNKIDKIVVPINYSKKSLQIMPVAGFVAQMFNSKVDVIAEDYSDPNLKAQLKVRISLLEKEYKEMQVDYKINLIKSKQSFLKDIFTFAKKNNSDLIAVAHDSTSLFSNFDRFTQHLITNNDNIPCLIVNAKFLVSFYY